MNFSEFMKRYQGETSPMGELAQFVYLDYDFPTESRDPNEIKDYLSNKTLPVSYDVVDKAIDYFNRR